MVRANCLCGDVAWEAAAPLEWLSHCHCSICRKTHGTAFASYGAAAADGFRLTGGDGVRRYESSPDFFRCFCGRCGSALPGAPNDGRVFVPVGGMEGDPGVRPIAHIFAASKAPWYEIEDALARFDAYPPGVDAAVVKDDPRPACDNERLRGSCQCGTVAWEIEGRADDLRHCHCLRCRRARSAAHASNLFAPVERFRFTRGEDALARYKIPEADRFAQAFCSACGSPQPMNPPGRPYVVVPGGSLDGDPGLRPTGHIFAGSKASWFEIPGALPQYDEYPPA